MAGTQTLIGTQVPLDAAYIANLAAGNNLTARGQDINQRGQDIQMAGLLAQFEQAGQAALQEYYNNVAQFGLDKATAQYQKRLADAQLTLQGATVGGEQRGLAANLKLDTLKALSDRSGPQNWVGYDYMLGKLGQPTGQRVDPFSWADSVVDPRFAQGANTDWTTGANDPFANLQGPQQAAGLGGMPASLNYPIRDVQSWQYQLQNQGGGGGGGSYQPAQAPGAINNQWTPNSPIFGQAPTPATNISGQAPEDIFSGVRNQDVAGLTPGQRALLTTGTGGTSKASDYTNFKVYEPGSNRQYNPDETIAAGVPIWMERLSKGGAMRDKIAIVGEGASAKNLGKTGEILINWTGAPIDIVKNSDAKKLLDVPDDPGGEEPAGQEDDADEPKQGEVTLGREMKKMGKGTSWKDKLASYDSGTVDLKALAAMNQQAIEAGQNGVTPEMRAWAQQHGLGSNLSYATNDLHYQTPDGAWNAVNWDAPGAARGVQTVQSVGNDPRYAYARAGAAYGASGPMGAARLAQMQSANRMPPPTGVFGSSGGVASQGGAGSQSVTGATGANATATDATGGAWGMPDTPDYIKYDPATIGNQPFIKALQKGNRGEGQFGGFGSSLSNPKLGIMNAPTNINLQGFNQADQSQQQATAALYNQGLGVDFNDIFNRAAKAAPTTRTAGAKRYGR